MRHLLTVADVMTTEVVVTVANDTAPADTAGTFY